MMRVYLPRYVETRARSSRRPERPAEKPKDLTGRGTCCSSRTRMRCGASPPALSPARLSCAGCHTGVEALEVFGVIRARSISW